MNSSVTNNAENVTPAVVLSLHNDLPSRSGRSCVLIYNKTAWHLSWRIANCLLRCCSWTLVEDNEPTDARNLLRAINNFEDVFGEESGYISDTENAITNSYSDNDESTLQDPSESSISSTSPILQKRKLAARGPDGKTTSRTSKRKRASRLPVADPDDSQTRLEQSHERSDALRINEFRVDLALQDQRHVNLADSTKISYNRYQRPFVVRKHEGCIRTQRRSLCSFQYIHF